MSAKVSRLVRSVSDAAAGTPQHGAHPGEHLFEAERLDDVVVAAERQAGDLVFGARRAR